MKKREKNTPTQTYSKEIVQAMSDKYRPCEQAQLSHALYIIHGAHLQYCQWY